MYDPNEMNVTKEGLQRIFNAIYKETPIAGFLLLAVREDRCAHKIMSGSQDKVVSDNLESIADYLEDLLGMINQIKNTPAPGEGIH